jgi:hypothetical protein
LDGCRGLSSNQWGSSTPIANGDSAFPVSDQSVVVEWFMSLRLNMVTIAMPSSRPERIASSGKPGIAGAVDGPTPNVAEAESPVEPIAVIV